MDASQSGTVDVLGHRVCVSIPICFLSWGDERSHFKYTLDRKENVRLHFRFGVRKVAGMHSLW